jgi:hypothetical protein
MQVYKEKKKVEFRMGMENSHGCVLSAAMFFNYAVMHALSCSTLSVLKKYFSSNCKVW